VGGGVAAGGATTQGGGDGGGGGGIPSSCNLCMKKRDNLKVVTKIFPPKGEYKRIRVSTYI